MLAEELMKHIFGIHGIPVVVHADRSTSMASKTVATLLADLGVTRSPSRHRVSNDNPDSQSLFTTRKYLPTFPERFGSPADARGFMDRFTHAFNREHHHSGIGLHTPADVHCGHASTVAEQRSVALAAARLAYREGLACVSALRQQIDQLRHQLAEALGEQRAAYQPPTGSHNPHRRNRVADETAHHIGESPGRIQIAVSTKIRSPTVCV